MSNDKDSILYEKDLSNLRLKLSLGNNPNDILKSSLELCDKISNSDLVGNCYNLIADCLQLLGSVQEAQTYYSRALDLFNKGYNQIDVERAYLGLGLLNMRAGNYERALELEQKAYRQALINNNTNVIVVGLMNIAALYNQLGDFNTSVDNYLLAMDYATQFDLPRYKADTLHHLSGVHLTHLQFNDAIKFGEESIHLYKILGNKKGELQASLRLATIFLEKNDLQSAEAKIAVIDSDGIAEKHLLGTYYMIRGKIAHKRENNDEAILQYQKAADLFLEIKNINLHVNALHHLSEVYISNADSTHAIKLLTDALALSNKINDSYGIQSSFELLTKVYKVEGNLQKALESFENYYEIQKKIFQGDSEQKLRLLQIKYEVEKKNKEAEVEKLKSQHLEEQMKRQESELSNKTLQLVQQTDMLMALKRDLDGITRHADTAEKAVKKVREKLKEIPEHILNWEKFSADFRAVHPEFENTIKKKYPSLSKAEVKVCCLLRIGMNTREISTLLFLSERTVEIHRQHIRKKLSIPAKTDMHTALAGV